MIWMIFVRMTSLSVGLASVNVEMITTIIMESVVS